MPGFVKYFIVGFLGIIPLFFETVQDGIIGLASKIPVPDFIYNISLSGLPNNTLYFINLFQLDYGLSVVIVALLTKIIYRKMLKLH